MRSTPLFSDSLRSELNPDVFGSDVDMKADAESLGESHQRLDAGIVISGFEPSDGRLMHPDLPGQCALRDAVVFSEFHKTEGDGPCQRRALPGLAELRITKSLFERIACNRAACGPHLR
jgi:hypothetical protein